MDISFADVDAARAALIGVTHKTPLDFSNTLSKLTGASVSLKLENLQRTGSFKVRGAYWKMKNLDKSQTKRVIAASAGNHAQGTAFAASRLGIPCTIVMPENASTAKVAATSSYGASIVLAGTNFEESLDEANRLAERTSATMIHPFNDPLIIAGQGTVALEVLEEMNDIEAIVVPVGGGGLISGMAVALKEHHPEVKIVGVQSSLMDSMVRSKRANKVVEIPSQRTIADGIAVKSPGELTFKIVNKYVDYLVTVTDDEIAEAIFLLLERSRVVVEPAGAAAPAALLSGKIDLQGKKVVAVVSGGNVDMPLMNQLVTRGLITAGRIVRLIFELRDRPGALKEILEAIAYRNVNVLDVQQDRLNKRIGLGPVNVLISMETKGREQTEELLKTLRERAFIYRFFE